MRKATVALTAAAIMGGIALMPTPASAFCPPCVAAAMLSKEDKNFKPVNPYAPTKTAAKKSKKKR